MWWVSDVNSMVRKIRGTRYVPFSCFLLGCRQVNPFRTPVPFGDTPVKFRVVYPKLSSQRDCSPKRGKTFPATAVITYCYCPRWDAFERCFHVTRLLFVNAVRVNASVETSRHRQRRHPSRRGSAQTERLLFFLGKPRKKGSRFALARLVDYITGQSGMPLQQYDSWAGAGNPTPNSHL